MTARQVKARREAHGLSMSAFARELGVTPAAVSRWESGDRRILPHIAKLIGLTFPGDSASTSHPSAA